MDLAKLGWCNTVFTEKTLQIRGATQLKPMLLGGPRCIVYHSVCLCVSAAFKDYCPFPELTGLLDRSLLAVDAGQIPSVQQPGKVGG